MEQLRTVKMHTQHPEGGAQLFEYCPLRLRDYYLSKTTIEWLLIKYARAHVGTQEKSVHLITASIKNVISELIFINDNVLMCTIIAPLYTTGTEAWNQAKIVQLVRSAPKFSN